LHHTYRVLYFMANLPETMRSMLAGLLTLLGNKRLAEILLQGGKKDAYQFQELTHQLLQFNRRYYEAMLRQKIDVIITAGFALPAFKHNGSADLNPLAVSTFLFNVTRMPAGSVPITVVREDEQYYKDEDFPAIDILSVNANKMMKQSKGLPIGIQVAALPYHDELVLRAMKIISEQLSFEDRPALPVLHI
jgi:fatty acid amide hydrolase